MVGAEPGGALLTAVARVPVNVMVKAAMIRPPLADAVMPVMFRYCAGGCTPAEF